MNARYMMGSNPAGMVPPRVGTGTTGIVYRKSQAQGSSRGIIAPTREEKRKHPMKKSLVVNLILWIVVAAATIAFLAWYHLAGGDASAAMSAGPIMLGTVLAAPVLLYAMGAVLGLLLIIYKDVQMGRTGKRVALAFALLALALILIGGLPALAPGTAGELAASVIIVHYVTAAAPILIMMFGFLYALGFAPTDTSKRSRFAKYLPKDHFE